VGGRHFVCTGQAGLLKALVERERGQRGEKEKHTTTLGAQRSRTQVEPPHLRDRRRRGPWRVGAFIVLAAGSPCKAFFWQEARDGNGAQAVSLSLEGLADIVEGEVLLPQSHDVVTDGITFWSVVRSCAWLDEEGSLGVLAELVAEHAETPGGRATALGDLLRGEALNKVSP